MEDLRGRHAQERSGRLLHLQYCSRLRHVRNGATSLWKRHNKQLRTDNARLKKLPENLMYQEPHCKTVSVEELYME